MNTVAAVIKDTLIKDTCETERYLMMHWVCKKKRTCTDGAWCTCMAPFGFLDKFFELKLALEHSEGGKRFIKDNCSYLYSSSSAICG